MKEWLIKYPNYAEHLLLTLVKKVVPIYEHPSLLLDNSKSAKLLRHNTTGQSEYGRLIKCYLIALLMIPLNCTLQLKMIAQNP